MKSNEFLVDEIEDDNSEVRAKSNQAWNTLKDIYVSVITDINKKVLQTIGNILVFI